MDPFADSNGLGWYDRDLLYYASSGTTVTFIAAISGKGTLVDPLLVARAITEAILGQASVVAPLKVSRPLTDAIAGAATMVDPLKAVSYTHLDVYKRQGCPGSFVKTESARASTRGASARAASS